MKNGILGVVSFLVVAGLLTACGGDKRQMVPFDWRGDQELIIPGGVMGRGCADGLPIYIVCFDPPIHAQGMIHSLTIEGHDVPLADTRLREGMLQTQDFGAVEIIMPRTDLSEMLATRAQIRQIQAWLRAQEKDAKQAEKPE